MQRLILFILLITVVYSWEEFKYLLVALWSKISKQNFSHKQNLETDQIVADVVILATIPLSLAYLLFGRGELGMKLLVITAEVLVVSLILKGLQEYAWRRHFTRNYEGYDKFIATGFSLLGLISPSWNFATRVIPKKTFIGNYLLTLLIPLIIGVGLVMATKNSGIDNLQPQLDQLIVIAVLGLAMNLTIEILEHAFRLYRLHLSALLRVVLGILIIVALQQNFYTKNPFLEMNFLW